MLLKNKRARFEFDISKTLVAGIELLGQEVKSLRLKHGSLSSSFVKIIGDEAFLVNAQINPYSYADTTDYDAKRTRKLLIKKKEVFMLKETVSQRGWAIVPIQLFLQGKNIKLEIGIGRGKKEFEKRAVLKERAIKRDVDRELKKRSNLR